MADWQSAEGARRGHDLESEQAEMVQEQNDHSDEAAPQFPLIEHWTPEDDPLDMEVGVGGTCNECGTELIEDPDDHHEARLRCTGCGLVVGAHIVHSTTEGGEPAADVDDWPFSREEWEIEDGRATITYALRGTHTQCDAPFAENTADARFGVPPLACSDCGTQLGFATTMNVLADPLEEGES